MGELTPKADRLVVAIFAPLWILFFALSLSSQFRHQAYTSVFVARSELPDGYPVVTGFRPWLSGRESELRIGDHLISVGDADLRAVGPYGLFVRMAEQSAPEGFVPVVFERDGERRKDSLPVASYAIFWPFLIPSLAFALTAVLLALRAPPSPMASAFARTFLCIGVVFASYVAGSRLETYAATLVNLTAWTLVFPLVILAALRFPMETLPESWLARTLPWVFAAIGPLVSSSRFGVPLSSEAGESGAFAMMTLGFATVSVVMTRNYPRADAIGRRQLRWVFLGFYFAAVPPMLGSALAAIDLRLTPVANFTLAGTAVFPLSILVAVARYNLFDVDRLITATTSYNLIVAAVVAAALVVVPPATDVGWQALGVDPSLGRILLSLALAAFALPAHRRLQPWLERVLFSERYEVTEGIAQLISRISACAGPRELTELAGRRLNELLRPESCVIYGRVGEGRSYAPVFAKGRTVPPVFELSDPLIATLRSTAGPLVLSTAGRPADPAPLSAFERAVLETLDAALVLPARRGDDLRAFVCLGRKRSGDVYTTVDVGLLTALADRVSIELLRFDEAALLREGREMREALRRYVPSAIAEEIESGRDIVSERRHVSVLFVDIHGYTGIAQARRVEEIFSTVNRYTRAVSGIVSKHGGTVAEFNGDGMMAVFGAPRSLPNKERAAVEAGRDILMALGSLVPNGGPPDSAPIRVGIGVATGEAFVGNIHAADRTIWSAIGNTTNLAARLQVLTHELDAAMVIDDPTCRAAGAARHGFMAHENTAIRGRRGTELVHVLRPRTLAGESQARGAPPDSGSSSHLD